MSGFDYRGSTGIVTGASSGIGRAIAIDLARRGTRVALLARRREPLLEVLEICRRTAPDSFARPIDVTEQPAVEAFVGEAQERFGRVDVLVNNAGIPLRRHAVRLSPAEVEQAMSVNFLGAVFPTLALLPSMVERHAGHVVNIGSIAGRIGAPRDAAYSASKFALAGWSESLAIDLYGTGVGIHLITVGPVKTPFGHKLQERASYRGPLGRPEDVAAAVRACLERGGFERTAPWWMGPVPYLRMAARDAFLGWVARFDRRVDRTFAPSGTPPRQMIRRDS